MLRLPGLAGGSKKILNFRGWFIIDLVAAIPFDLLLFGSDTDEVKTAGVSHCNRHGMVFLFLKGSLLISQPIVYKKCCRSILWLAGVLNVFSVVAS